MAVVGEAHVIVRAITDRVKSDLRNGFKGSERIGTEAGQKISGSFSRAFNAAGRDGVSFFGRVSKGLEALRPGSKQAYDAFAALQRKFYVFGTVLGGLIGGVGALGNAILALAGALAGAAPSMVALGGAMVALKLGGMVGKLALKGVTEAAAALTKEQKGLGKTAREIAEDLQQLAFDAEEAALSEQRASLSLEEARERLAMVQDLPPNSRVRREAELAYAEADLNMRRAIDRNKDLQEQQAKGSAGFGRTPIEQAMAGLNIYQKNFAKFLAGLSKNMTRLRLVAARGLLPPLQNAIGVLVKRGMPVVEKGVSSIAIAMGKAANSFARIITSTQNLKAVNSVMQMSANFIEQMGKPLGNIFAILVLLLKQAAPLLSMFTKFLNRKTKGFLADLRLKESTGELRKFFMQAGRLAAKLGAILGNTFGAFSGIVKSAVGKNSGGEMLLDWFKEVTGKWKVLRNSPEGIEKMRKSLFMGAQNAKAFLQLLGSAVRTIFGALQTPNLGEFFAVLQKGMPSLKDMFEEVGSALPIFGELVVNILRFLGAFAQSGAVVEFFKILNGAAKMLANFMEKPMVKAFFKATAKIHAFALAFGLLAIYGGKALDVVVGGMSKLTENLDKVARHPILTMLAALAALFIYLYNTNEQFKASMDATWKTIQDAVKPIIDVINLAMQQFAKILSTEVTNGVNQLIGPIGDLAKNLMSLVPIVMQALVPVIQIFMDIVVLLAKAIAEIAPMIIKVLADIVPFIGKIIEAIGELFVQIAQVAIPIFKVLINAIIPVIEIILDQLVPVIDSLLTAFLPLITDVLPAITPLLKTLALAFQQIFIAIGGLIEELMPSIMSLLGMLQPIFAAIIKVIEPLANLFAALVPPIMSVVDLLLKLAGDVIKVLIDIVISLVESLLPVFDIFVKLLGPIESLVKSLLPPLKTIITSVVDVFISLLKSVMPVIDALLDILIPTIDTLVRTVIPPLFKVLEVLVDAFAQVFKELMPAITSVIESLLPVVADIIKAISPLIQILINQLGPIIEDVIIPVIQALIKPLTGIIKTFADIVSAIAPFIAQLVTSLLPVITQLIDILVPLIDDVLSALIPVIGDILEAILPLIANLIDELLPVFGDILKELMPFISALIDDLVPVLMHLFKALTPVIDLLLDALLPFLPMIGDLFKQLVPPILDIVKALVSMLVPGIKILLAVFEPILDIVIALVDAFIGSLEPAIGGIVSVVKIVVGVFQGLFDNISKIIPVIANGLAGAFKGITGAAKTFADVFKAVFKGISSVVKGVLNGLLGALENVLNFIINAINLLLNGINFILDGIRIATVGAVDVKLDTLKPVKLTRLAKGGTVMPSPGGSIVNIAEAGKPERVVPLDSNGLSAGDKAVLNALKESKESGGTSIEVNVYASEGMSVKDLAAEVSRQLMFSMRKGTI